MFQRVLLDFVLKTFGLGAENETRTRDPNLGKVVLYQLSYFRIFAFCECKYKAIFLFTQIFCKKSKFFIKFYLFARIYPGNFCYFMSRYAV